MKILIKSTVRPALFKGGLFNRIVAGSILEVNGKPWDKAWVAVDKSITLDNIVWLPPSKPDTVKPKMQTIIGSKGDKYVITIYQNGNKTCTCPGYKYRKTCKHLGAANV